MIFIKLMGGLGNQLFQYAYGRALSLERGEDLKLDVSWYKGRKDRHYLLNHFNISAKIMSFFNFIFKHEEILTDTTGGWHSEKYFVKHAHKIRQELTLKTEFSQYSREILKKITLTDSVSIHFRGGDYVHGPKSGYHKTCSPEYYKQAVDRIKREVPNAHFFIFTDDLSWAKTEMQFPEPFTITSNENSLPYEDLILMSSCKHNIIANSTFSWWSAWLNRNPQKIVIAPEKWFNDEKHNISDILPSSWIRI